MSNINWDMMITPEQKVAEAATALRATTFRPLRPYQFKAFLAIACLEAVILAAFETITDPVAKAVALAKFHSMDEYHRGDPLFDDLGPIAGMTEDQIDDFWLYALSL